MMAANYFLKVNKVMFLVNSTARVITLHRNALAIAVTLMLMTSCSGMPWFSKQRPSSPEANVAGLAAEMEKHPNDKALRNRWYREREVALNALLAEAEKAEASGDEETAGSTYARILQLDPHQRKALEYPDRKQQRLETKQQIALAKAQPNPTLAKQALKDVLIEQPSNVEAKQLELSLLRQDPKARAVLPTLQVANKKPVTLELRDANIKVVFEALSRATGINFVLDKDIKPETKTSVFVKKLPIEEAIDLILASNGLNKKVIGPNSVMVFPASPQKAKDYQELLIRNFYFSNSSAKQTADMLRSILKIKDIYIDERLNMLVIRERPEVMVLAEKMIRAQDIADPEVMLEIEVLEVTRGKLTQLGINYPGQLSVIDSPLTLEILKSLKSGNFALSPNPSVQFNAANNDVDLLSNPRIRVKNNEKAKVQVGNKVPVITTNTITGGVTSESVSYVDVGLKLEVEPRIMMDDFVNIKVNLEVSSLGEAVTLTNNSKVFNIGTRNASTTLRLKHGETQILAGLIQDSERKTINKLPGLGDIPLVGRLFGRTIDDKTKTEIVLAITPKILSNVAMPEANYSEYWSGTESVISDKPLIQNVPTVAPRLRGQEAREQQEQRLRELNDNTQQPISDPEPETPASAGSSPALAPAETVTPASTPPNTSSSTAPPSNVNNDGNGLGVINGAP